MNKLGTGIFGAFLILCAQVAAAQETSDFNAAFEARLLAADIGGAIALAEDRLAAAPDDRQAQFALGTAEFLDAVENLTQALYRQGLNSTEHDPFPSLLGFGVRSLPFLRLPVPRNPAPEPFSADILRQDFLAFSADLARANASLAQVQPGDVILRLDIGKAALDMDGNGRADPNERLQTVIAAVAFLEADPVKGFPIFAFDAADVVWLQGYSELLLGITDMILAHDWRDTVDYTFTTAFPAGDLRGAPMARAWSDAVAVLGKGGQYGPWGSTAMNAIQFAEPADLVAFIHLWRWPVLEPERLHTARLHLLKMIDLSRRNWELILAETDDDHEWIPAPWRQRPQFDRLVVTQEIVDGWADFLNQAQAVLEGRLLIPHWRFVGERGLNVMRMFEEPQTLDPLLLITGSGALPYLEDGPRAPGSTMSTGMNIVSGGLLAYFLWFN